MTSTTAAGAESVASGASALGPFTQTFVQTSGSQTSTVAYTLVGQVLDNGQTNWVGYDEGMAEYLYTASVANAVQTTLDGETYYVSSGSAPAGYLATAAGETTVESAMTTSSGVAGDSSSSSRMSGTSTRMTTTASGSAAQTSMPSSGHRVSAGAAFAVAMGLLAVMAL